MPDMNKLEIIPTEKLWELQEQMKAKGWKQTTNITDSHTYFKAINPRYSKPFCIYLIGQNYYIDKTKEYLYS